MTENDEINEDAQAASEQNLLTKVFIGGLLLWGFYLASRIPTWSHESDKLFPILVLSALFLLGFAQLFTMQFPGVVDLVVPEAESGDTELQRDIQEIRESSGEARQDRLLLIIGLITVLPILIYYLGFLFVFPPFVFGLIWYFLGDFKTALASTIVFVVAWYFVFIELLNIPIWLGQLFGGTIG